MKISLKLGILEKANELIKSLTSLEAGKANQSILTIVRNINSV